MDKLSINNTTNSLSTEDKHILHNESEAIISELCDLLSLIKTSGAYVNTAQRLKLLNAIYLAVILQLKKLNEQELSVASETLTYTQHQLKKDFKNKTIIPCLEKLIHCLDKSADDNLMPDLEEKLKLNAFDDLFDSNGVVRRDIRVKLNDLNVWRISPQIENQKINVWGESTVEDFNEAMGPSLAPFFTYHKSSSPVEEERDDNCIHVGCELVPSEYDYRFNLTPAVRAILKKFHTDNDNSALGSVGLFVHKQEKHYLITAAHVLFPELSRIPLESDDLRVFNEQVSFAIYDDIYDIAIIPHLPNHKHSNSIRIVSSNTWFKKPGKDSIVVKVGSRSGLTLGNLESIESFGLYNKLVRVSSRGNGVFAQKGDSGSIYFAETKGGFLPFALHRLSDNGSGLGSDFHNGLSLLLSKLELGDIDEFEACIFNELRGCYMSHTKNQ